MPIFVHEDIACVEIRECEYKWTIAVLVGDELGQETTHHGHSCELFLAVNRIVNGIWLVVDAVVATF